MAIRAHVLALTFGLALGPSGAAFAAEPLSGPGYGPRPSGGFILRGNDRFIAGEAPAAQALPGGLVSLNLVEAPLPNAAKAVLADTLGLGYTLDPQATGTVTLQTGGAVTREALLQMFEAALASRGLVLRRRGRIAQIAPAATDPNAVRAVRGPAAEAGAVAVPLRWVSAVEMQAILTSVAPRDVVLRADRARNLLILNGDATQIRALRQTIEMFDVDWMRGMSTAMLPVRSASPVTLARDMTQMFGGEAAGTGDVIRFIPNEALRDPRGELARRPSRPRPRDAGADGGARGRARAPALRLPHPESLGPGTRSGAPGCGRRGNRRPRERLVGLRRRAGRPGRRLRPGCGRDAGRTRSRIWRPRRLGIWRLERLGGTVRRRCPVRCRLRN